MSTPAQKCKKSVRTRQLQCYQATLKSSELALGKMQAEKSAWQDAGDKPLWSGVNELRAATTMAIDRIAVPNYFQGSHLCEKSDHSVRQMHDDWFCCSQGIQLWSTTNYCILSEGLLKIAWYMILCRQREHRATKGKSFAGWKVGLAGPSLHFWKDGPSALEQPTATWRVAE